MAKPSDNGEKPREFPQIIVPKGAYGVLQTLFDDGVFSTSNNLAGGKDSQCEADAIVDDVLVQCPHTAVIKAIHIDHCNACDRDQKKTDRKLCIAHAAVHFGAHESVNAQLAMDGIAK